MTFPRSLLLSSTHSRDLCIETSYQQRNLSRRCPVVSLDRPSQRLLQNKKQEKEQLLHHAGNSESRTRFLPSSHDVVVKTKVLGNFLSILILEPVVSGVKIKCDRCEKKISQQVNHSLRSKLSHAIMYWVT